MNVPLIFFLEVHITVSFSELPVPPEVRGYWFCPLVKVTAQITHPGIKRRKQEIGSVGKPTAFGRCCLLQACRRAFRLLPSPPHTLMADVSPGPSRGPGVTNCCSQRVALDQLPQHHLVPPNYTESKTLGVGPSVPIHS